MTFSARDERRFPKILDTKKLLAVQFLNVSVESNSRQNRVNLEQRMGREVGSPFRLWSERHDLRAMMSNDLRQVREFLKSISDLTRPIQSLAGIKLSCSMNDAS